MELQQATVAMVRMVRHRLCHRRLQFKTELAGWEVASSAVRRPGQVHSDSRQATQQPRPQLPALLPQRVGYLAPAVLAERAIRVKEEEEEEEGYRSILGAVAEGPEAAAEAGARVDEAAEPASGSHQSPAPLPFKPLDSLLELAEVVGAGAMVRWGRVAVRSERRLVARGQMAETVRVVPVEPAAPAASLRASCLEVRCFLDPA